ncbi:hypothetical protein Tsubulata_008317 [Turnera subulata]|uniref:WRKY domain-containing protein n=1 Tax=Turnera subulata TaxID=218843 RepID=A0A9Q0FZE7_9ROSI|nr:hypothetical protein Tsubulata_008317 [Turnera subulata]
MEDYWDLQAVVRSGYNTSEDFENTMNNPATSLFAPLSFEQDELSAFPEIFETTREDHFHGLEGTNYSPSFYPPMLHQTLFPQSLLISTTTTTTHMSIPKEVKQPPAQMVQRLVHQEKPLSGDASCSARGVDSVIRADKMKKSRKNQHKKVVQEVTEDDLSSDKWAWRKYGQKPIKGSPYPRSYYRCSSSKGCLARKQMERSSTDPSTFNITYTGEHSHPQPTRRNSLAGSTRNKSSLPKGFKANEPNKSSITMDSIPSPTTGSMASSTEEDFVQQQVSIKTEQQEQSLEDYESNINGNIAMPDIDELFPSLEDLEGLLLDQLNVPCSLMDHQQQFQAVDTR